MNLLFAIAAAFYALASLAAGLAWRRSSNPVTGRRRKSWLAISGLFAALVPARLLDAEHALTAYFRQTSRVAGEYAERGDLQRPLAALAVLVGGLVLIFAAARLRKVRGTHARALWIARFSAGAMLLLIMLRVLSLHAVDALLYRGGMFRLNYLLDIGTTLLVIATGMYCAFAAVRRPRRGR